MQLKDVLEEYFFLEVRLIIRFNDNQFYYILSLSFWNNKPLISNHFYIYKTVYISIAFFIYL